jgi:type IV pilus biogenesis protein CpaD/CtpE
MRLKHPLQVVSLFFATLLLSSCAALQSMGLPAAETFNQKLVVAYSTVTQVRETAVVLLQSGKISADDAQNVQASADVARMGLDSARKTHIIDPNGATNKLTAIRTTLAALAAYLATKGG